MAQIGLTRLDLPEVSLKSHLTYFGRTLAGRSSPAQGRPTRPWRRNVWGAWPDPSGTGRGPTCIPASQLSGGLIGEGADLPQVVQQLIEGHGTVFSHELHRLLGEEAALLGRDELA